MRRLPLLGKLGPDSIAEAMEQATAAMLKEGVGCGEHAQQGLAWFDAVLDEAKRAFPPSAPIGCAEGCAYCCHLKVIATPTEVIALADELRASLTPEQLQALRERVAAASALTRGATAEERARARVPCPVLVEGRCAGYAARPLHCAGANSFDPSACQRAFERPDEEVPIGHYPAQRLAADALAAGLSRGLLRARLDGRMVELVAGLLVALDLEDAEARWRAGEPVFVSAVDRELDELVRGARRP